MMVNFPKFGLLFQFANFMRPAHAANVPLRSNLLRQFIVFSPGESALRARPLQLGVRLGALCFRLGALSEGRESLGPTAGYEPFDRAKEKVARVDGPGHLVLAWAG
jgi:hypothetical protein